MDHHTTNNWPPAHYNSLMDFDWQLIVALGIVAIAAALVVRAGWKSLRGKSAGCGSGCGKSCNAAKSAEGPPLVMLGEAEDMAPRR